ncbi:MAG: sulfotransferase [Proteobacteria bacterium]|nr:sulfotransferase [Pseudomonadota bacterium]
MTAAAQPLPAEFRATFMIAGVQKGGSSALARYLYAHPQVCMASVKEPHFFNKHRNFARATPDYAAYHALYAPRPGHVQFGEATPTYVYWPDAPRRIAAYNPAMRFVLLLRDPAQRAYSHWNMLRIEQREDLSFDDALRAEAGRIAAAGRDDRQPWTYADRGHYARQLAELWRWFPREQTLVLRSEELQRDAAATLARITGFLGIAPFAAVVPHNVYALPYAAPMSAFARDFLAAQYADGIAQLEAMLGWDLAAWKQAA